MRRLQQITVMFLPVSIVLTLSALLIAQPGNNNPAPPQRGTQRANSEPLPEHKVTITEGNGYRTITANGIPDHEPGAFPNRGNPNSISAQDYTFRVTLEPKALDEPKEMRGYLFGVALNGVPFDPGTAEVWTPQGRRMMAPGGRQARDYGWNYDALSGKIDLGIDEHHAHVQPTGAYHYHGLPTGLIEHEEAHEHDADGHHVMTLVGYAADGFPMYARFGHKDAQDASSETVELKSSYRLKDGTRPGEGQGEVGPGGRYDGTYVQDFEYVEGLGDLDECNGRFGVTPEYPDGTYYYVLTDSYPFVPRLFRGEPDASFRKARGGGPGGRGGPEGPGGRGFGPPPGDRDDRRPPPPR